MITTAKRNVTEIETYTGQYVNLLNPDPRTICVEDIAAQLSNICRFNGAVSRFYSVAEHAIRVSKVVQRECPHDVELQLAALHHDSHEAYIGDATAPLKQVFRSISNDTLDEIAGALDGAIASSLRVSVRAPWGQRIIKAADDEVLYREAAALKYSHGRGDHWGQHEYVRPYAGLGWSPDKAEREFLKRHNQLEKKR